LNARQRVQAALKREPTDRVPVFMWFHPDTARWLGRLLEIPAGRVAEAMGDDVRQAWVGNNAAMESITHEHDGETHIDDWGIEWMKVGPFNQIRHHPLRDASEDQARAYRYPYNKIEQLLQPMRAIVTQAGEAFIGCDVSPCVFEMVCRIRGMERALLDVAAAPQLASEMLAQAAGFSRGLAEAACARFPLDWLWTGDDVAGQQAMILSPTCWRAMIRPHLTRIFEVGKSLGRWVAFHSCGAIRPIIPDLIEMGLDVLNPIQCNCPGMDPIELKVEFGRHLAFMGGVDTQNLLPNGTVDDVRRDAARLVEHMTSDGGGYILAASHAIPPETPVENIFALYEAAGVERNEIFDRAAAIRAQSSGPWRD
jgi:uroporphyrinogen decarboxylase